jgi:hypothetical protein
MVGPDPSDPMHPDRQGYQFGVDKVVGMVNKFKNNDVQ